MRIGSQEIQYLNVFQSVSKTNAKDCLIGQNIVSFVVKEGQMGLTIGKNGANVKKLRSLLKKNVELFEHKKTAEEFLAQAFPGISFTGFEIENEDSKKVLLARTNNENKKKLLTDIGKIKRIKEIAKRNYEIDNIRIGK